MKASFVLAALALTFSAQASFARTAATQAKIDQCVEETTETIIDDLNAMHEVLRPIHTDGIEEQCREKICIEVKTAELIESLNQVGGILQPHHTDSIEEGCKSNSYNF